MKDAIITFVKPADPENPELSNEDEIFSFFYSKILEAEDFCRREGLRRCFVGYRNYTWLIQTSPANLLYPVEVTDQGLNTDLLYTISDGG